MKELTEETFNEALTGKSVVDFMASWCGVCKMLHPKLEETSLKFPTIKFYLVDVDKCPGLAEKYLVGHLPTLVMLEEGQEVMRGSFDVLAKLGEKCSK